MSELLNKAAQIIGARGVYEQKQRLWYLMRHDGLRRRNKPFATAADSHFPLIDMSIRKFKPFYLSQALSADRLASFVSTKQQLAGHSEAAADYFDFQLKNHSQFTRKLRTAIDYMLLTGRGILKVVTDPFNDHAILFEAVDPKFVLMPETNNDFEDADWFVHVRQVTVPKYLADQRYNHDDAVLAAIRGGKENKLAQFWTDKELREGITHSRLDDIVILWEHYERSSDGWIVHTYSPQAVDMEVRKPFKVPYRYAGKCSLPFFSFTMEVKDEGWYAPRGLAELCAPFEVYATKLWNEKADAMTFGNRPVFTSDQQIPNTANLRWNPGEFIPGNIKAVTMPQPAFSFDQEINFSRSISEQLVMMPDFGVTQDGSADKPRTATENNRIAQLQSVGVNDNGLLFREELAKVYRHVWGLMLQFKREDVSFLVADQIKVLPEQALHDNYLIQPAGATDEWDRSRRLQKAMMRLQTFKGAPNIDQDQLVRDALAADDARLVDKLLVPGNVKSANEAEDEAMEIAIMQDGFPASVGPGEDHATRIHVLTSWLQKQGAMGVPVNPLAMQRVTEHLMIHAQNLKQTNPDAYKQTMAQVQAQMMQPAPGQAAPGVPGQESPQAPQAMQTPQPTL